MYTGRVARLTGLYARWRHHPWSHPRRISNPPENTWGHRRRTPPLFPPDILAPRWVNRTLRRVRPARRIFCGYLSDGRHGFQSRRYCPRLRPALPRNRHRLAAEEGPTGQRRSLVWRAHFRRREFRVGCRLSAVRPSSIDNAFAAMQTRTTGDAGESPIRRARGSVLHSERNAVATRSSAERKKFEGPERTPVVSCR